TASAEPGPSPVPPPQERPPRLPNQVTVGHTICSPSATTSNSGYTQPKERQFHRREGRCLARRFDLEELLRLPSYYLPTVSPTRDQVAFYWNRTGRIELYTMDLRRGGEPGQVTDGQLPRSPGAGFSWLHDGSAIVFPKDNDG